MINKAENPGRADMSSFNDDSPLTTVSRHTDDNYLAHEHIPAIRTNGPGPSRPSCPSSIDSSPPDYYDQNFIPSASNNSAPRFIQRPSGSTVAWAGGSTVPNLVYTMSPRAEAEWNMALHELDHNMGQLRLAKERVSKLKHSDAGEAAREVLVLEQIILSNMWHLSRIHPDPHVQAKWASRAETFSRTINPGYGHMPSRAIDDIYITSRPGSSSERVVNAGRRFFAKTEKDPGLSLIAKGTAGLFLLPMAVSGVIVYGTAALAYGSGKAAVRLGRKMMSGSTSGKRRRKSF